MKTMKERIRWINETAQEDFERAQGMLDMFNDMCGTELRWLDRRVVWSEAPSANMADFYANCNDFEAWL